MIQYKPWLYEDRLANNAEFVPLQSPQSSIVDYIPVIWTALLIFIGTVVYRLRREDGQGIAEYAVMFAVLLAAAAGALHYLGVNVLHLFRQAAERVK